MSWEVYPIGGDPGWSHTANKLNNANSFKMKFAIVAGVIQMVAGVCCKLMNTIHFKDVLTMYFVYVPKMVFMPNPPPFPPTCPPTVPTRSRAAGWAPQLVD